VPTTTGSRHASAPAAAALAQWTDRASATGNAAERRAGGTAAGAIDAMLDLVRGQVTRDPARQATRRADQQSMKRPARYGRLALCQA
jgi:hypothetical protein